jgi:NAD(P)-dependent dehydrogenase (short-subunit alcohol dehydrogenase family)
MASIVDEHGGLDVLVANAGIAPGGPLIEMDSDDWRRVLDVNVTGTFFTARAAVPHLKQRPGSSIVVLGSTAAFIGLPGAVAYGVTKAAVVGLAKGLALELAEAGIRVNALCPGGTLTPATQQWLDALDRPEAALAQLRAGHPIGRLATPDEQAAAAAFLASSDASFVTGSAMLVDGGYTAR